jgi:D-3-phosphoglycerate dehydrogenase
MWKWASNVSKLSSLTAGIVGFGRTGQAVAKRLKAFGTKIMAFDPYARQVAEPDVTLVGSLKDLLPRVDILCLHAFLSEETHNMIGEAELKSMKTTAILVNASRGALINEASLHAALCQGWIAGAALDVMEPEPPSNDNPLLKSDRVIITPHVAFYSQESLMEQRKRTAEEVVRALQGLPALHPLTKA